MSKFTEFLSPEDVDFIQNQKIFFVSTASKNGKINLSPKGLDETFKIINKNKILWLNYFGSANETAAHLLEDNRMTIMFCSFEKIPNILRLYCKAKAVQEKDLNWNKYINNFQNTNGARQIFEVTIETIHKGCGMGVPLFEFISQRKDLPSFYNKLSKNEQIEYMKKNNQISFDGKETKLFN